MTYGMPYCGSKNRIAMDIIAILPKARDKNDPAG